MVADRQSIVKVGLELAELVVEGGGSSGAARRLAEKLASLCKNKGVYQRRYETHEERVLYRHLNLFKNKLAKAENPKDIAHWKERIRQQESAIASHTGTLDLDGL